MIRINLNFLQYEPESRLFNIRILFSTFFKFSSKTPKIFVPKRLNLHFKRMLSGTFLFVYRSVVGSESVGILNIVSEVNTVTDPFLCRYEISY